MRNKKQALSGEPDKTDVPHKNGDFLKPALCAFFFFFAKQTKNNVNCQKCYETLSGTGPKYEIKDGQNVEGIQ